MPIISDPGHNGGYSLLNNFIRAPLLFDMEEKKALLHAAIFAKEAGYPLSKALGNVTSKLKMYSNQEQESILNHHLAGFEVINRMVNPSIQSILAELEQAVEKEFSVEIDYRTSREEQPKNRMIDPYGMVYWNSKWYTVAFCHPRNEIRSFWVDRILLIKCTQIIFKRLEAFSSGDTWTEAMNPPILKIVERCLKEGILVAADKHELDATSAKTKATYAEIKNYMLKAHGLKVSNLYISQVKENAE